MNNQDIYYQIAKGIKKQGGTGNVMDALQWGSARFDEGFVLANELQNLNWIKLLYSNYTKNLIVVELTLVGISKTSE